MGNARVDTASVRTAAQRFDTAAQLVDGALGALRFDGAAAGRGHVRHGDEVHNALSRLATDLARWSRSASEIAATLRADADRYAEADARAAAVLR